MTSKPSLQAATESSRGSQKSADMTLFVQDMLDQMVSRYSKIRFEEGNGFQVLLLALFVNLSLL
jgi:hypothetical protein